uniref:Uncharacterized protein n=1 Tax=Caenorhabditis japonica TaxID=281687 RepID=A0A8R1I0X8_CAEJA
MSEGHEMADVFSDEAVSIFKNRMMEMVRSELLQQQEEKTPELAQRGLQVQAETNTKILNVLKRGIVASDPKEAMQEAMDLLRRRNQELILLDKDPAAMKNIEKLKALSAITGASSSGEGDAKLLALAQLMSAGEHRNDRRPSQPPRRQFFRRAGSGYQPAGVRDNLGYGGNDGLQGEDVGGRRQGARMLEAGDAKRPKTQCFGCGGFGHYANHTACWHLRFSLIL